MPTMTIQEGDGNRKNGLIPPLDIRSPVFYAHSMEKILGILFSLLLVFAGFGSVPRCYVMQPDCAARGTFQCPFAHPDSVQAEKGCSHCPQAHGLSRQPKTRTIPPFERLARFSIDQDRHNPDLCPDRIPTMALIQNAQPFPVDFLHTRETVATREPSLPEPPLLILLQKQSFLI